MRFRNTEEEDPNNKEVASGERFKKLEDYNFNLEFLFNETNNETNNENIDGIQKVNTREESV